MHIRLDLTWRNLLNFRNLFAKHSSREAIVMLHLTSILLSSRSLKKLCSTSTSAMPIILLKRALYQTMSAFVFLARCWHLGFWLNVAKKNMECFYVLQYRVFCQTEYWRDENHATSYEHFAHTAIVGEIRHDENFRHNEGFDNQLCRGNNPGIC